MITHFSKLVGNTPLIRLNKAVKVQGVKSLEKQSL